MVSLEEAFVSLDVNEEQFMKESPGNQVEEIAAEKEEIPSSFFKGNE